MECYLSKKFSNSHVLIMLPLIGHRWPLCIPLLVPMSFLTSAAHGVTLKNPCDLLLWTQYLACCHAASFK